MLQMLPISQEPGDSSDYLNVALLDLMRRYGKVMEEIFQQQSRLPLQFHLKDEQIRSYGVEPATVMAGELKERALDSVVVVQLRLLQARGVGLTDLKEGADLFCVAFVGDLRVGQKWNLVGNRLFQTKVVRGKTEDDWTWNEVSVHYDLQHVVYNDQS